MESLNQIRENLEIYSEALPDEFTQDEPIVPIMRTVFVCRNDATKKQILERLDSENRHYTRSPSAKTPKVIARAMEAPIEERVVVGSVAEVTDQLALYRNSLGMNLMVVRPQISGTDESERIESLDRLLEEVWPQLD